MSEIFLTKAEEEEINKILVKNNRKRFGLDDKTK